MWRRASATPADAAESPTAPAAPTSRGAAPPRAATVARVDPAAAAGSPGAPVDAKEPAPDARDATPGLPVEAAHNFDGVSHTMKEETEHIAAELDRKRESELRNAAARRLGELTVKSGLTQEQHDALRAMLDAERTEIHVLTAGLPEGEAPSTDVREHIAALRKATDDNAGAILHDQQKAAWAAMRNAEDRTGTR